jgi:hypothetical protein
MILFLVLEFKMAQPPLFGRLMAFLVPLDDIGVIAGQDAMDHAHLRHLLGGNLHRQLSCPEPATFSRSLVLSEVKIFTPILISPSASPICTFVSPLSPI